MNDTRSANAIDRRISKTDKNLATSEEPRRHSLVTLFAEKILPVNVFDGHGDGCWL